MLNLWLKKKLLDRFSPSTAESPAITPLTAPDSSSGASAEGHSVASVLMGSVQLYSKEEISKFKSR
jgi:hypothetical protein